MFDTLRQDIRYAIRSLSRRPAVTAVAIASLAIGIGLNTAVFSVFERLLLRSLPVPSPEDVVLVGSPGPRPGGNSTGMAGTRDYVFSVPLFRELERLEDTGLSWIAAHRDFSAHLAHGRGAERGEGLIVSGGYFPALGIAPALGRLLSPEDDRIPGGHSVVVLTHTFWTTRFGGDPGVVGGTVTVNNTPMTIVGVTPAGFTGVTVGEEPQIFVPLAMREQMRAGDDRRDNHWLYLIGRLSPGTTRAQVEALLNVPFARLIQDVEFPVHESRLDAAARQEFLERRLLLEDGGRGRSVARNMPPRSCGCSLPSQAWSSSSPVRTSPICCSRVAPVAGRTSACASHLVRHPGA
jgi:hypothetical protein